MRGLRNSDPYRGRGSSYPEFERGISVRSSSDSIMVEHLKPELLVVCPERQYRQQIDDGVNSCLSVVHSLRWNRDLAEDQ